MVGGYKCIWGNFSWVILRQAQEQGNGELVMENWGGAIVPCESVYFNQPTMVGRMLPPLDAASRKCGCKEHSVLDKLLES